MARGRPVKTVAVVLKEPTSAVPEKAPKRKTAGRPPKNLAEKKSVGRPLKDVEQKKRVGRPPKSSSATAKAGPGRPPKSPSATAKAGPGRPPKSPSAKTTATRNPRKFKETLELAIKRPKKAGAAMIKALEELEEELKEREEALKSGKGRKEAEEDDGAEIDGSKTKSTEYQVEKILASRRLKGLEYLVLWVGYVLEESTWEPKAHLKNSSELIEEFYAINPAKPGGPEDPRRRNKTKMKLEAAKNVRESKAAAAAAPAVAATATVEQPIAEEVVSDDVSMD